MKKLFKKLPLVLMGATASIAPLGAVCGVIGHHNQQHSVIRKVSNSDNGLVQGSVHYTYNGTSTSLQTITSSGNMPNWNPSLGKRNLKLIFDFATWKEHRLCSQSNVNYNDTGKNITVNVIKNMTPDQYEFTDISGYAEQIIKIKSLTYTINTSNQLSYSMTYQVYSTMAANSIDISANAAWYDTSVPSDKAAGSHINPAFASMRNIDPLNSSIKPGYHFNIWTDQKSCQDFVNQYVSCFYNVPVGSLGLSISNYKRLDNSNHPSHFVANITIHYSYNGKSFNQHSQVVQGKVYSFN